MTLFTHRRCRPCISPQRVIAKRECAKAVLSVCLSVTHIDCVESSVQLNVSTMKQFSVLSKFRLLYVSTVWAATMHCSYVTHVAVWHEWYKWATRTVMWLHSHSRTVLLSVQCNSWHWTDTKITWVYVCMCVCVRTNLPSTIYDHNFCLIFSNFDLGQTCDNKY